ncbi:hypothetical protein [Streptomyces griseicoloratus]|uniref:hypothetical protein n=1 Tax=Streptomyces griseicoloratus TaxID=2752516 RepID=UPI00281245E0|nr:hypothetical protein [Streptomyces griseicoloratus]
MTQSGQGEEPSARHAREGIVLPSDGSAPLLPGPMGAPAAPQPGGPAPAGAPAGGQAWDRPWGPEPQQGPQPGQEWPAAPGGPWGSPDPSQQAAQHAWPAAPGGMPPQAGPGPLPPEGAQPPAYGTPGPAYGAQPAYGTNGHVSAPLPAADEGATQYLPPVAAPADEGATQYIPPVTPGALPPERPVETPSEETRFLGRAPQHPAAGHPMHAGPGPLPGAGPAPAAGPDAEATQYIAPVPGGPAGPGAPYGAAPGADEGRQPPAEFDNLFRSEAGGDSPASATQQLPRFDEPGPPHPAGRSGYAPQGPGGGRARSGYDGDGGRGGRGGRTGSRLPLLAAVGVGIAVVGIGAGALLAGGGGEDDEGGNQPVSATAPATSEAASSSPSPSADPVRQQAVELDKLLADSGSSRTAVINAVEDVKSCDNLAQAAKDLRDAAKQRTGLVTSLSQLSVDKLPAHAELTAALTKAWQASASADNHYAAWADQTAGKKGCKKGKARVTSHTQAANRASGTASTEKAKAAKLWNAIAKQYGLTERQPTQL